jgi:hypothetical protein
VDFGSSSAVHLDIPRGNVYNNKYLEHLIDMDRKQDVGSGVAQYGLHKVFTTPKLIIEGAYFVI